MFGLGASAQEQFLRGIAQKTGLVPQGNNVLAGVFQGFNAWTRTEMVADVAGNLTGGDGLFGALGAVMGGGMGGMANAMTGGAFFMKHDYVIEMAGTNLPPSSLRETSSFLVNKTYTQRGAFGQRVSSGVQWIDQRFECSSSHPQFMPFVCSSQELQQMLNSWPFVNLSWNAGQVWLELLDSTTRIHSKFGTDAMQNGDMVYRGLCVAVAAARATLAR